MQIAIPPSSCWAYQVVVHFLVFFFDGVDCSEVTEFHVCHRKIKTFYRLTVETRS